MKRLYTFVVYTKNKPKEFTGIFGPFTLYCPCFLLVGGKRLPTEQFEGTAEQARDWYCKHLESQGMVLRSSKVAEGRIWIEVDGENTDISEFTLAEELEPGDTETLAWWRTYYPCSKSDDSNTKRKECLGFGVVTREIQLSSSTKYPLSLDTAIQFILSS